MTEDISPPIDEMIHIEMDRRKLRVIMVACIMVVILGTVLVAKPDLVSWSIYAIPVNNTYMGLALIALFTTGFLSLARVIWSKSTSGLFIGPNGISDHSSGTAIGFVPWDNILEIRAIKTDPTKLICIFLSDNSEVINRLPSGIKKTMILAQVKTLGTPVAFASNNLNIHIEELLDILDEYLKKHKNGLRIQA